MVDSDVNIEILQKDKFSSQFILYIPRVFAKGELKVCKMLYEFIHFTYGNVK